MSWGRRRPAKTLNGEPWFIAKDVCDVLGLDNPTKALLGLDPDEKALKNVQSLGGSQATNIISESGLFALVLRSKRPEAKAFRKWVTGTVLPTLRKTGSYVVGEEALDKNAPDYLDRLKDMLLEAQERKLEQAEQEIAKLKPNPYDGHTLGAALEQVEILTERLPELVVVDRGYRGHGVDKTQVLISGARRGLTPALAADLRRRAAIEPEIGHMKTDGRLARSPLKGTIGDALFAVLCGCGHNIRKILAWLRAVLRKPPPSAAVRQP